MARLRSDFWVSAYLRQRQSKGVQAVLLRRGAAEAGAIFIRIDRLDGVIDLYGPAFQGEVEDGVRRFRPVLSGNAAQVQDHIDRELRFDVDLWVIDVEDRTGEAELDLSPD
jgi:hypothetical protein